MLGSWFQLSTYFRLFQHVLHSDFPDMREHCMCLYHDIQFIIYYIYIHILWIFVYVIYIICNILQYNLLEMKPIRQTIPIISIYIHTMMHEHSSAQPRVCWSDADFQSYARCCFSRLEEVAAGYPLPWSWPWSLSLRCRCDFRCLLTFRSFCEKLKDRLFVGLSRKGELP